MALSTSSPIVSVAALAEDGSVLGALEASAPRTASGTSVELLQRLLADLGLSLDDASGFAADVGPGSFTGIRVGVTLAKCLAFAMGVKTRGATSFDLVRHDAPVAIPIKRGDYHVRMPDQPPSRLDDSPPRDVFGYGPDFESPSYPKASNFSKILASLNEIEPEALLPFYAAEPSVSQPKRPFLQVPNHG